jgi:Flp pilus assembly pilin Flp
MTWTKMRAGIARLRGDRSAATAIEYAMIAAIICLALISMQYTIGSAIISFFTEVGTNL